MQTILQVDDDPNDIYFFRRAMKKIGLANSIQAVPDGQQAIDYVRGAGPFSDREKYPLPRLVLLDLKLPYVMGLEVLKWYRLNASLSLIVIILSASAEDADIAAAYAWGANAFLTKPAESSKLDEIVRALQSFWLNQNVLPQSSSTDLLTRDTVKQRLAHDQVSRAAVHSSLAYPPPEHPALNQVRA